MNDRLKTLASLIPSGIGFADIGTDHGYIPAYMASHGYKGNIIASDINNAPLNAARRTAAASGVADKIQFCLSDGLTQCDPAAIDTVLIAGMGGDLICRILDEAEWTMDSRYLLILQPMTKAEVLRYWLSNNEYEIISEHLVRDGNIYQILCVRFGRSVRLNDSELYTGKFDQICADPLFPEQLDRLISRFNNVISSVASSNGKINASRLRLQQNIMNELVEMRGRL